LESVISANEGMMPMNYDRNKPPHRDIAFQEAKSSERLASNPESLSKSGTKGSQCRDTPVFSLFVPF